jgi:hypothetical protein
VAWCLAAAPVGPPPAPADFKKLTPGLWEGVTELSTLTPVDGGKAEPSVQRTTRSFCVDDGWKTKNAFLRATPKPPEGCKDTIASRTPSKVVMKTECLMPTGKSVIELTVETKSPKDYVGHTQSVANFPGREVKTGNTFTAKWVAASCSEKK